MGINKIDVRNADDLQKYLYDRSSQSERLYHFTTFESLLCIIKNRSFRLSRMDLMNDRAEQKLGNQDQHLQNYIMSFTREKEYVSMWAMYGRPSGIKLRVDFQRKLLVNAINDNFYMDSQLTKHIPLYSDSISGHFSKKDFLVSDVVYLDKHTNELRHNEKSFRNITATDYLIQTMTGFIKYDAWEFEREVRLRTLLHNNDPRNYGINNPDGIPKYIFAGINEELIRDFRVTFNPWMSEAMKEEVQSGLERVAGFRIPCKDSDNDGEITEL